MEIAVFQVDAFTRTPLEGNPAGVVLFADALSSHTMQAIARELNNSETAFLPQPTASDHDVFIRYFTPTMEVPICGHATIAAHYVRARTMGLESGVVLQRSGVGILPIEVRNDGGDYGIMMTQKAPRFGEVIEASSRRAVLDSLRMGDTDAIGTLPIQAVSTGSGKILVPVASSAVLDSLEPDMPAVAQITRQLGTNGIFAFTFDTPHAGTLTSCRMFAPAIGIPEDPVTGNGNGPLGAYLVLHGVLPSDGRAEFRSLQGRAMKRPGRVRVEVTGDRSGIRMVRVGDEAVIAFETRMRVRAGCGS